MQRAVSSRTLYSVLGNLVSHQQRGAQIAHTAASREYEMTRYVAMAVVLAAVTIAAVFGLLIAASLHQHRTAPAA